MSKDPNYVIKIEKAIAERYGEETIQNPKKTWTDDKEKEYLFQLKELYISFSTERVICPHC
jgi:hypothetical protein